jgi:anti-anti-sigma regulatory factor
MKPYPLASPSELTLRTVGSVVDEWRSAPRPVEIDLTHVVEIDLAGLQLLAAAAADAQILFTASRPGPVTAACQLAGINPHNFLPGDDHA